MTLTETKTSLAIGLAFVKAHPSWYIFPIKVGAKFPPCFDDNLTLASNSPAQIERWARTYPGCNWGLSLAKSNVIAIDVDTKPGKSGQDTFDDLDLEFGFPKTLTVQTPSGGRHHYYQMTVEQRRADPKRYRHVFDNTGKCFGRDIDSPNYTLIPGCKIKGGRYIVTENFPVADAQEWMFDKLNKPGADRVDVDQTPATDLDQDVNIQWAIGYLTNDAPASIEGENGDNTLLSICGVLKDRGVSQEMSVELIAGYYNKIPEWPGEPGCDPLWAPREIEIKVGNAWAYLRQNAPGERSPASEFATPVDEAEIATATTLSATAMEARRGDDPPPVIDDSEAKASNGDREARAREAVEAVRGRPADEKERRYSYAELCNEWVWISTVKRFINRLNTEWRLDKDSFNDRFRYLKGDYTSVSNRVMSNTEDTMRKLDGMIYKPNAPEFTDGMWNGWRPSGVEPIKGDTTLFYEHVKYLFPDKRDQNLLLDWMAGVLQNIGTKPRHQLIILGREQGTGKTFFARVMEALIGKLNCQVLTQDILESGFTGWGMKTKFVRIEEVREVTGSKKASSKLHTWASESTITINEKNLPTFVMDQVIAFVIMSNKDDALALDNSDRRYAVLRTLAKVHPRGTPYYDALYGNNGAGGILNDKVKLSAILYELLNRKLTTGYSIEGRAPATDAKADMILSGASEVTRWMVDHDGSGPLRYRVLNPYEIIDALPRYLQRAGVSNIVRDTLRDRFGAVAWPTQIRPDGRAGDKLRVWVRSDALTSDLTTAEILSRYRQERGMMKREAEARAADDFGE